MRLRVSSQAIAAAESRAASNPAWTRPARCWAMEAIAAEASVSSVTTIAHALKDAFLMAWEVWWALVLGFAIVRPRGRAPRRVRGPRVQFLLAVMPAALRAGSRALFRAGPSAARGAGRRPLA